MVTNCSNKIRIIHITGLKKISTLQFENLLLPHKTRYFFVTKTSVFMFWRKIIVVCAENCTTYVHSFVKIQALVLLRHVIHTVTNFVFC